MNRLTGGPAIVLYLAVVKLLFHPSPQTVTESSAMSCSVACSKHFAWGRVDQPPLIALITWLASHLFGDSLLGLRVLTAIAGAALVWLTGKLAREMGGRRFAQLLPRWR